MPRSHVHTHLPIHYIHPHPRTGLLGAGLLRAFKRNEALDPVASTFIGAFFLGALAAQQYLFPGGAPKVPAAAPLSWYAYALSGVVIGFGTCVV